MILWGLWTDHVFGWRGTCVVVSVFVFFRWVVLQSSSRAGESEIVPPSELAPLWWMCIQAVFSSHPPSEVLDWVWSHLDSPESRNPVTSEEARQQREWFRRWPDYVDWLGFVLSLCCREALWFLLTARSALPHTRDTLPPSSSIPDEILNIAVTVFPLCVNIRWSVSKMCWEMWRRSTEIGRHI